MIKNRTVEPEAFFTLPDAKQALQVSATDDDVYIMGLIQAASISVQEQAGKALGLQTWEYKTCPISGRNPFCFPLTPLVSVLSISYFDTDNASQSLDVADFTTYSEEDWAQIVPNIGEAWPTMYNRPDALTITARLGFATIPQNLVVAGKMLVGNWYENRDAVVIGASTNPLPMGVEDLISISRKGWAA